MASDFYGRKEKGFECKKEKEFECKKEEDHECKKEHEHEQKHEHEHEHECNKKDYDYYDYGERKEEVKIPCKDSGKVLFPQCTICGSDEIETTVNESARVLNVRVKLKKVCGNKKICLGVLVFEKGKLVRVRAQEIKICGKDHCTCPPPIDFWFIFEDKDLCESRKFEVKVVADYCEC